MNYLHKRLTGDCQIPLTVYANDFTSDKHNNIVINYLDEFGNNLIARSKQGTPHTYQVTRLNDSYLKNLPKEYQKNKYKNPTGLEVQIYATGLHRFFHGQTVETLVVTEGQIKSYVACYNGIATIGITGLFGFGRNENKTSNTANDRYTPQPELQRICELYKVKNLIYLHDGDYLSSEKIERNDQFYTSVKRFKEVCESLQAIGIYKHVASNSKKAKGLDDLILAYQSELSKIQCEISILEGSKGSFFHTYQLNDLETLRNKFYSPFAPQITYIIDKYVSEYNELTNEIKKHPKLILTSPTGSGKTTYFLNQFLSSLALDEVLIFCVPTLVIANQHRSNKNVCVVTGAIDELTLRNSTNYRGFVTTYDSVQKVVDLLEGKKFRIVIDECHNLVGAMSYRANKLRKMFDLQYLSNCVQMILTSATAHQFFKCLGFTEILIKQARRPVITRPVFYTENYLETVLNSVLDSVKNSFVVCQIDNVEELKALQIALNELRIGNVLISSQIDDIAADKDYIDIINFAPLRPNLKVVLTTCLLNEGISINNPKPVTYILAGKKGQHRNLIQSIQLQMRVRNATSIIFVPILREDTKEYISKKTTSYELFMRELCELKKYDLQSNFKELANEKDSIATCELYRLVQNLCRNSKEFSNSDLLLSSGIDVLLLMQRTENEHAKGITSTYYLNLLSNSGLFDLQDNETSETIVNDSLTQSLINTKEMRKERTLEVATLIESLTTGNVNELYAISKHTEKENRPTVSTTTTEQYKENKEIIDSKEFRQVYRKIEKLKNFGITQDVATSKVITKKQISKSGMMQTNIVSDIQFNNFTQFVSLVICRFLSTSSAEITKQRNVKKLLFDYAKMLNLDTVLLTSNLDNFYAKVGNGTFELSDLRASLYRKGKHLSDKLLLNILHSFFEVSSEVERIYTENSETKQKKRTNKTTYKIERVIPINEIINSVGIEKSIFVSSSKIES
jgi:hypothetical protein